MVTIPWTFRDTIASKYSWWLERISIRYHTNPTTRNKFMWDLIRLPIMHKINRMA